MVETTEEYRARINQIKTSIEHEPYMRKTRDDIAEGVSMTGVRQASLEDQFQDVIDGTTGKDVISAPEIIAARNGEPNLDTRLTKKEQEFEIEMAQNMLNDEQLRAYVDLLQHQLTSMGDISPEPYATYNALVSANPSHSGVYVVTEDGNWYYWNSVSIRWTAGGTFQASGVANKSVGLSKISTEITNELAEFKSYTDFLLTNGWVLSDGTINGSESYRYCEIDCRGMEVLKISSTNDGHPEVPLVVFKDNSNSIISYIFGQTTYSDYEVFVPNNAVKMFVNSFWSTPQLIKVLKMTVADSLSKLIPLETFKNSFDVDISEGKTVIANNNKRTEQHSAVSTLRLSLSKTTTDSFFNGINIPIEDVTGCSYVGIAIKDDDKNETHILKYKNGVYSLLLDNVYNLKSNTYIYVGYLDSDFKTTAISNLNVASYNSDANVSGMEYYSSELDFNNIISATHNTPSASWIAFPYELINVSNDQLNYHDPSVSDIKNKVDSYLSQNEEFIIPSKIHMINGVDYYLYPNSILTNYNEHEFLNNDFSLSNGTYYGNDLAIIPNGIESTVLSVKSKNGEDVISKNVAIDTKVKITVSKNVLIIGDSFFANKWGDGIMGYIDQFATVDGNNLSFVGTINNHDTYFSESIGGWSESMFYTESTSKFVFDNVFNFEQYLSANSIVAPEVIVFFLGMNGGNGADINNMISNIKLTLPNVKVVVCTVPGYFTHRANVSIASGEDDKAIQNLSYIDLFDGRETENIYLCPTHMSWNRTYHYIHEDLNMLQFDLDNIDSTLPICTNHHPMPSGAKSLGYIIYNYILYSVI